MTQDVLQQAIALNNELQMLQKQKQSLMREEDEDDEAYAVPQKKLSNAKAPYSASTQVSNNSDVIVYKGCKLMLSVLFDTTDLIALYNTKLDQQIATIIGKIEAL